MKDYMSVKFPNSSLEEIAKRVFPVVPEVPREQRDKRTKGQKDNILKRQNG